MSKFYVGVDIAKLSFYAAIRINGKIISRSFSNQEKGFNEFYSWLREHSAQITIHVCMESTGKYSLPLAEFLHDKNLLVSIVNPAKIKYYMKSKLSRNKTDKADSIHILDFCAHNQLSLWAPVDTETKVLQELTKRLDAFTKTLIQEQNRLDGAEKYIEKSINKHIEFLEKEIKSIKIDIKNHIKSSSTLKEKAAVLGSVPGIGPKTQAKVLAFLGNVEKFKNAKSMASFVGLTPQHFQSGTSLNYSRLSKVGSAELRNMLYMPTLVATKYNSAIKVFYERLLARRKTKKQAICAAMRKLVHIIYGVLKNMKPFDEHCGN